MDMQNDIYEVPSSSPNFKTELAKKLQELIPEAIADGKVDTQKLKELLADDSGDDTERFGLFWPGKKRAMRAAQEPTSATLKPAPDESKDWDTTKNLFIEGDNLEVLKVLQRQYHNKIKMIYIDPPYNTGKDFVYPDNFKEGLANYLEFTKQVDEGGRKISTNSDTEGRYHSNWLNMMYPRLKLARNLLTDDGVIFISIDDNEQDNLKKLCNEIYGENNFIGTFVVNSTPNARDYGHIGKMHDYVLAYAKSIESSTTNFLPDNTKVFKYKDSLGGYNLHPLYNSNEAFHKENRPNLYYAFYLNPQANVEGFYDISLERKSNWVEIYPPQSQRNKINFVWRWGRLKSAANLNKEIVGYRNNDGDYRVVQKMRHTSKLIRSMLIEKNYSSRRGTFETEELFNKKIFDFPKPVNLLKDLIFVATENNSIILDFFSGSSTTAHAVMQLNAEDSGNRRHIQVQLPEPTDEKSEAYKAGYKTIAQIARERINRAGEKIKQDYSDKLANREQPLDIGYRTYKLADTNFIKWQNTYTQDVSQLQARLDLMRESSNDSVSQLDLLTEIILKLGLELTTDVRQMTLENLPIYSAAGGSLLLYLDEHITPALDQLRTILESDHKPVKFVILEDSFKGDDQLKTNLTQICKSNSIELWTV